MMDLSIWFQENQNTILVAGVIFILASWFYNIYIGSGEAFHPYYSNFNLLNDQVFSLDRRIDTVPSKSFVNQFNSSRKATCVDPGDWRLWQSCDAWRWTPNESKL